MHAVISVACSDTLLPCCGHVPVHVRRSDTVDLLAWNLHLPELLSNALRHVLPPRLLAI